MAKFLLGPQRATNATLGQKNPKSTVCSHARQLIYVYRIFLLIGLDAFNLKGLVWTVYWTLAEWLQMHPA